MVKNIYTIPPDVPFVEALAEGVLREAGTGAFSLSDCLILLPTRRACLHLREAFGKLSKGAALLPRMQPIGDIDEEELYFTADSNFDIPPAIAPLRRQLLLTQLITKKNPDMTLDQAALLAEALARLLDEVQIERKDFSGLETLVKEKDLAKHWQETVAFLDILTKNWPLMLAEEGCIDPATRRNLVIDAQAEAWRKNPPTTRVIAAGSTGSMQATADLLVVIAGLPQGAVILPGLDQDLHEGAWQEIKETHPQYTMKHLLEKCGVKQRSEVKLWNGQKSLRPARVRLLQESMRPAETSEAWRELTAKTIPPEATAKFMRLELDHPQEEAQAIALVMRETLEKPGKTASLVTPDRRLAERVGTILTRWDINVNDSGGTPLSALPTGSFLVDALKAAAPNAHSVERLALLKHPLAAFGLSLAECRRRARQIEVNIWREELPEAKNKDSQKYLDEFTQILRPFTENWNKRMPLIERIKAHIALAEKIAATDSDKGDERLWNGEEGEAAAGWLDNWQSAAADFPALSGGDYMELFMGLLRGVTVRGGWDLHPRLSILGPLEARLIHTDLMILGGLNEGVWPPEAQADPWMSRPMKHAFGLPLPERRIGLSAHDFVQLASADEVVMTRAARLEGAPSVPSRFLLQLETVMQALGYPYHPCAPWQAWAKMLDEPDSITPCDKPNPRPPVSARPTQLSVTEIGTWRRNPYAIYARRILGLKKLGALEAEADASDRGTIIHDVLDDFMKKYPDTLPDGALGDLLTTGRKAFGIYKEQPEVQAFWWPRFESIAAWFIETERTRRAEGIQSLKAEAEGAIKLGAFTLKGRADRIDRMADGMLSIADYKTGRVPSQKEVTAGYEPQLPLLALIASEGGFEGVKARAVSEIAYWELGKESEIKPVTKVPADILMQQARAGLEQLITKFADPSTPYQAVPKPEHQPRHDDYAHLARLREWGRTEED